MVFCLPDREYREDDLKQLFCGFGEIQSCRCSPLSEQPFGFIAFKEQSSAEKARKRMFFFLV